MSLRLEDLPYQRRAIDAVLRIFDGQQRSYFTAPQNSDCFPNELDLTPEAIAANVRRIAAENGISEEEAAFSDKPDYCVEMETGTGKTLVYLHSVCELCREYGFTKFIILVPSVPIREGVLDTIESFRGPMKEMPKKVGEGEPGHYETAPPAGFFAPRVRFADTLDRAVEKK